MVPKKQLLNFPSGNKGVFFLLDIVIASVIVGIILIVSMFFISRAEESPISKFQASRIVSDIFATLDYNDELREFDVIKINREIERLLPPSYLVEYKIACENRVYDSRKTNVTNYIFSGERVFVDNKLNNCILRYWIWLE